MIIMSRNIHVAIIIMPAADGLTPIWRQDICNHRDYVTQSVFIRSATRTDISQFPACTRWILLYGVLDW